MPPQELQQPEKHISKSLIILGIFALILTSTTFIPARWFHVTPVTYKNKPLSLSVVSSPSTIADDTNKDGVISWQEIVDQNLIGSTDTIEKIKNTPIDEKAIEQLNDINNLTASFAKNLYITSSKKWNY